MKNYSPLQKALIDIRKKVLTPPPVLNLVEWADTYVYLSPESSSVPGKWKTSTVEAAREPMLEVTNPRTKIITVMGCTQLLKTSLINNIVGYFIHQDPSPMIVMQPTDSLVETWSKERFDKMVRDTPVLNKLVLEKRRGESDNTVYSKTFPGGQLNIVSARSPSELASRPVRIVLCDEIDKYPASAGKEGDPIKLIEERTDTFWNALKVRVCSPTIEGESRIAEEYYSGDQRTYHGLCPYCNKYDELVWEKIKFPNSWKKPDDVIPDHVKYQCGQCEAEWTDFDRLKAINKGKYFAKKPFKGHASFKVNKLASPWGHQSDIVRKYLDAKGSPDKEKTFWNTQMAETWKVTADAPDYNRLYERRETYNINKVNKEVVLLTCGVDVQANRLELEIVGWAKNKESWSIDYRVIPGQTSTNIPWDKLDEILKEHWITEDGRQIDIRMLAVDTGYNTQHVYNWVRKQDPNRVRAVKGQDWLKMVFGKPTDVDINYDGRRIRNALRLWPVGVSLLKGELYSWLKMKVPEKGELKAGYCHFPEYDENYFKGLCSEHLVEKRTSGRLIHAWEKIFDRNEPLDCRVYARAAASMYGIDRFTERDWNRLLGEMIKENQKTWTNQTNSEGKNKNKEDRLWNDRRNRGGRGFW